ncbi:hypothetical protein ES705_41470 [subsurface metagenome]
MWRGYPNAKIFFLLGSGGNGKSRYLDVIERVIGKGNGATESTQSITRSNFSAAQLFEKFVNISAEMEYSILSDLSWWKRLTGGDLIHGEFKYERKFPFHNFAKMICVGNALPQTADASRALYRRAMICKFPYEFEEDAEDTDPFIIEKMTDLEIEGLALKCLEVLKEMRKRNFVFTRHKSVEVTQKIYEELSRPINKFIEIYCIEDFLRDLETGEFQRRFNDYLKSIGRRTETPNAIGRMMRDIAKPAKQIKRRGRQYSVYPNLRWRLDDVDRQLDIIETDKNTGESSTGDSIIKTSKEIFSSTGQQNITEIDDEEYIKPEDNPLT